MSEQKKHPLMVIKDKRPMKQAEAIAIRLGDVLPVVAEEQLKALAPSVRLCNHALKAHSCFCACRHRNAFRIGSANGSRTRITALKGRCANHCTMAPRTNAWKRPSIIEDAEGIDKVDFDSKKERNSKFENRSACARERCMP